MYSAPLPYISALHQFADQFNAAVSQRIDFVRRVLCNIQTDYLGDYGQHGWHS